MNTMNPPTKQPPMGTTVNIQSQIEELRAKRGALRDKEMLAYNSGASRAKRTGYTFAINSINEEIEVLKDAQRKTLKPDDEARVYEQYEVSPLAQSSSPKGENQ